MSRDGYGGAYRGRAGYEYNYPALVIAVFFGRYSDEMLECQAREVECAGQVDRDRKIP